MMIDPFVLLAPIFLLGVMALLGFVGCFTKPPPPTPGKPFITGEVLGSLRSDAAWFGMVVVVLSDKPLRVTTLGRFFSPGNSGMHRMRIIDATDPDPMNRPELGQVTVDMAGGADGEFKYEWLSSSVILNPGGTYYVLSQEFNPGDQFYDQDTTVVPTEDATVQSGVYSDAPGLFVPVGQTEHTYGPVSFEYHID